MANGWDRPIFHQHTLVVGSHRLLFASPGNSLTGTSIGNVCNRTLQIDLCKKGDSRSSSIFYNNELGLFKVLKSLWLPAHNIKPAVCANQWSVRGQSQNHQTTYDKARRPVRDIDGILLDAPQKWMQPRELLTGQRVCTTVPITLKLLQPKPPDKELLHSKQEPSKC